MRILLIEDHDGIRQGLELYLGFDGHEVRGVSSGEEALELLKQGITFDEILLDLNTNGMEAHAFMNEMRKLCRARGWAIPRVGVASGVTEIELETRRIGADYFIRKPYDPGVLSEGLKRGSASPSRPEQLDTSRVAAG